MDTNKAIEYLMHFGMSRQEATVYLQLIEAGKQTGYEIARDTGISPVSWLMIGAPAGM